MKKVNIKKYINLKNIIIFLIIFPVWVSSFMGLYEDRQKIQEKIISYLPTNNIKEEKTENELDKYWAKEIMKGGIFYILDTQKETNGLMYKCTIS